METRHIPTNVRAGGRHGLFRGERSTDEGVQGQFTMEHQSTVLKEKQDPKAWSFGFEYKSHRRYVR